MGLNAAYNAGYRAGLSHRATAGDCPYKWWQFLKASYWDDGWESAKRQRVLDWLERDGA